MTGTRGTINSLQLILLLITAIGIFDHVIVIPSLLEVAGRDAWVSVILAGGVFLGWLGILYAIVRTTGQEKLGDWLRKKVGTWAARMVNGLFCLVIFLGLFVSIRDTVTWINVSYLPRTPIFVMALLLLLLCAAAAYLGLETIAIANGLILPFVILSGYFVMVGNLPKKDYALLFPVFQQGFHPVLEGMLYAGVGFVEIFVLLFLQHYLKGRLRWWPLLVTGVLLISLTLGPTAASLAEFGPEAARQQRYPTFEQWRLVAVGGFIEHVDFLSVYQWLSGGVIRASLGLFLLCELLGVPQGKKRMKGLFFLSLLIFGLVMIPISDMTFWWVLHRYLAPVEGTVILLLSLFLFAMVLWKGKKAKRTVSA